MIFVFVGWGEEIHGGEMGEFFNYEGDEGDGIYCCSDKGSETKRVSMAGFIVVD